MNSQPHIATALQSACIALMVMIAAPALSADPAGYQEAVDAANHWLNLIDEKKYQESWEQAAEYFKSAVLKEDWEQMARAVRGPLGNAVSRNLKSKQYTTTLPGAPDGEYVVIQYETSFENKKAAVETVTPMKDADGHWRVSGDYIK